MVAYTPNYLLPYQQGTDAPCDAPQAWCGLAEMVDTQQQAVRSGISRVDPAVPAVSLSFTPAELTVLPALGGVDIYTITFDTVHFDTDGMFDPSRSSQRIFPRRAGWYHFNGWLNLSSTGTFNLEATIYLTAEVFGPDFTGTSGSLGNFSESDVVMFNSAGTFPALVPPIDPWYTFNVSAMLPFGASPAVFPYEEYNDPLGFGLGFNLADLNGSILYGARMEAYWVRDFA